ncbi:MAG TPA: BTAD domain-containing putative transcriptional regulator, partial [Gemmatimonadales bacterium]|nr:BTAD domain-containing putative transcriptional regulator [Gemmatimonadales bacterium]
MLARPSSRIIFKGRFTPLRRPPLTIRLHLLGSLHAEADGKRLAGATAQPRRVAILAVLARAGAKGVTRERLMSLFWPDAEEEKWRSALSQALYALRRDLGHPEAILSDTTLRLNPAVITADVIEFEAALQQGDLARAADLCDGVFLEGLQLPGSEEFDRWLEDERRAISAAEMSALRKLAARTAEQGDLAGAAAIWRRALAVDPFDAVANRELMQVLQRSGDPAGALRHAQTYADRLRKELELSPPKEILALVEELRALPVTGLPKGEAPPPLAFGSVPYAEPTRPSDPPASPPAPLPARRTHRLVALALLLGLGLWWWRRPRPSPHPAGEIVVVAGIADFPGAEGSNANGAALKEVLTTDLAGATGMQVVSTARVYELLGRDPRGATVGDYLVAGRRAGATRIVDGAIYPAGRGRFRLDLRLLDASDGKVLSAHSVTGSELLPLIDSLARELVANLGGADHGGSQRPSRSLEASRDYEEGLRAFVRQDFPVAIEFFERAIAKDPEFALAEYYDALAINRLGIGAEEPHWRRAVQLAQTLPDRDRLMILAGDALHRSSPRLLAYAETLAVRYPSEVAGAQNLGRARLMTGDWTGAVRAFRTAIAMDTNGTSLGLESCAGCNEE